jgi:hypothetical protein
MATGGPPGWEAGRPDDAAKPESPLPAAEAAAPKRGAKRKHNGNADADASARSVSNLTPEQLERKRRNDREVRPRFFHGKTA